MLGCGALRAFLWDGGRESGQHVAVTDAPTEFGPVSYRLEPQADGTMRITLDPPLRCPPGQVRICLRDPQKRKVAAAQTTPAVPVEVAGESIILPQLLAPVDLRVSFRAPLAPLSGRGAQQLHHVGGFRAGRSRTVSGRRSPSG